MPYSTRLASAANGAGRSGNGEKALAIATITGSTMVSIIWSYRMVKPRTSPSRSLARTAKSFRPCMPLMKKLSSCSTLVSTLRSDGFFFASSNSLARSAFGPLMRKVSTFTVPCGEDQRVP